MHLVPYPKRHITGSDPSFDCESMILAVVSGAFTHQVLDLVRITRIEEQTLAIHKDWRLVEVRVYQ